MRGLIDPVFDRRLAADSPAPLAVALSGGGDSLALLILTLDWASRHGRRVEALVFDHALHPDSAAWTKFAVNAAQRLGASARALRWNGPKPSTGLPAAARQARHAALAQAARQGGASVLLMGHTADDRLEAAAMRAGGAGLSDPREWSPSPAWPQGRGVFLLRPLLDLRRADLRDLLRARGETWLDDPANDNPAFARARARRDLPPGLDAAPRVASVSADLRGWRESGGALIAQGPVDARVIAAACLSVGGGDRPPERLRAGRLASRIADSGDFCATLAHARVQRRDGVLTVSREPGRAPPPRQTLNPGDVQVWDGRFEIRAAQATTIRPLGGLAARLPAAQRRALKRVPAAARPGLPALVDAAGAVVCPILADTTDGTVMVSLVMARFAAACGQTVSEPI